MLKIKPFKPCACLPVPVIKAAHRFYQDILKKIPLPKKWGLDIQPKRLPVGSNIEIRFLVSDFIIRCQIKR
jgi:hypothetical protein